MRGKSEGVFCVRNNRGEQTLYLFEEYDDVERYQGLLEAEDFPKLEIVEIDSDLMIQKCNLHGYNYAIITPNDIIVPPREDDY